MSRHCPLQSLMISELLVPGTCQVYQRWLAPPWQSYWLTGAPLLRLQLATSRHLPLLTLTIENVGCGCVLVSSRTAPAMSPWLSAVWLLLISVPSSRVMVGWPLAEKANEP